MDKPAGPTSHDVVAIVRRIRGIRAAGHTGTLDPFATGLLVVLVGRATRLARFVEQQPKTYLAVARLGIETGTDDATGEVVIDRTPVAWPDAATVAEALQGFGGPQAQVPPAYSAKKVAGVRSYARARAGETVDLAPVPVTVHAIDLVEWTPPAVTFRCTVSPGTYVRAIARDLGRVLGTGAHLTALRREAIGALRVEDAVPLDALSPDTPLREPLEALSHLPRIALDSAEAARVAHGQAVVRTEGAEGEELCLVRDGRLVAVAERTGEVLRPRVVLEPA